MLESQFQSNKVEFQDHCEQGCHLLTIAENIERAASEFEGGIFPSSHACIIIWSGSDFSWLSDEEKDKLALDDSYLEDKVSVLTTKLKKFERSLQFRRSTTDRVRLGSASCVA